MYNQTVKDGKTMAIISYITVIGTLIAFIMNQNKNNSFASFHIRQALGIFMTWLIINFLQRFIDIFWLDTILKVGLFALWVFGILAAIQEEEKSVPYIGDKFQEWFKNIG